MSKDGYGSNTINADARPENVAIARVDKHGYVVRLELVGEGGGFDFMKFITTCRTPLDPMDVVMPSPLWPVDADGRGLTVIEVERMQQQSAQYPQPQAAA